MIKVHLSTGCTSLIRIKNKDPIMIHDNELSSFSLLVPVHIRKKDLILISWNFVDFLKISSICIWLYQVETLFQMSLHFQNIMLYTWLILINTIFWFYEEVRDESIGIGNVLLQLDNLAQLNEWHFCLWKLYILTSNIFYILQMTQGISFFEVTPWLPGPLLWHR